MAIRIPDLGTGSGAVGDGDNELKIRQDYNHNFTDQNNAASRLVGTANGQVPLVEQVPSLLGTAATKNVGTAAGNIPEFTEDTGVAGTGIGGFAPSYSESSNTGLLSALKENKSGLIRNTAPNPLTHPYSIGMFNLAIDTYSGYTVGHAGEGIRFFGGLTAGATELAIYNVYTDMNVTKDANGFLKGASPVIDMYDNKIDLNHDAEQQDGITFEKLGVGNYLIKGSLGFAQEGWYIETPKDANGNVLVAVVYEQLPNNDLSIKTYAKKFDDETGDIVANLLKPRDIPTGRFISLRLHDLPKELPVMPTETQPEV